MAFRLLSMIAAALLAFAAHAQPQPIRIGAFLAVTGPAAFLGDPEQKTLELYVGKLNAAGGLLGRKLELVSYDSAGDAEKARTFARRLIEQDKVDVIVGGSTTGETMAVVPLAEAAGIPFISLAGAVVIIISLVQAPSLLYYPLSIFSIAGLLVTLTMVNTCIILVSLRREHSVRDERGLFIPALAGLAFACCEVLLLNMVRAASG